MSYASNIDLRQFAGPILDQGQMGSCAENALSSDLTLIMNQASHPIAPISRLALYADVRDAQNTFNTDYGTVSSVMFNIAQTKGLMPESDWTYTSDKLYLHPPTEPNSPTLTWESLNPYLSYTGFRDLVKTYLDQGKPVFLAFVPQQYFYDEHPPLDGQVNKGMNGLVAGHAVVIVGIDDNLNGGSYIVQNSWGNTWGDNGYGTISYSQFAGGNTLTDMEVVTGFKGLDFTYTSQRISMAQEYACLLNRPADINGMNWWATQLSHSITKIDVANAILGSPEGTSTYGSLNNGQFVEQMYSNILGRHSDSGGLVFWTNKLDTGTSRGVLTNYLIDAVNASTTDPLAHDFLANKTNISMYTSVALQYDGSHNSIVSHDMSLVTSDPNAMEIIKIGIAHDLGVF